MTEAIWLVLIPLIVGFALSFINLYLSKLFRVVIVGTALVIFWFAIDLFFQVLKDPVVYNLGSWQEVLGINLIIDPLGALWALLIAFISLLVFYYSLAYIQTDQLKYYTLLFLLVAGMMGLVLTGDLFNMFVFLEITSITSYALVAFEKKDISFEASFKYLIIGSVSGLLILLAIILIYQTTGSLNLAELVIRRESIFFKTKEIILALLLVGFGTKFAVAPLHSWLPDAHPAAPSPISALLSGVVIKVYLYALLRTLFILFPVQELLNLNLDVILTYGGGITLLVGHLLAYQQDNLKRLLAYSSIAQIGYIMIGIGLFNSAGLEASIYHIINHAVVKGALFLTAGIFLVQLKVNKVADLRGGGYKSPLNSFIFTIAALNIIGLPPFNLFISKWLLTTAALETGFVIPAFFIPMGSILALTYYLRIIKSLYSKEDDKGVCAINWTLTLPTIILSSSYFILALFPNLLLSIIQQAPSFLLNPINYYNILLGGG